MCIRDRDILGYVRLVAVVGSIRAALHYEKDDYGGVANVDSW